MKLRRRLGLLCLTLLCLLSALPQGCLAKIGPVYTPADGVAPGPQAAPGLPEDWEGSAVLSTNAMAARRKLLDDDAPAESHGEPPPVAPVAPSPQPAPAPPPTHDAVVVDRVQHIARVALTIGVVAFIIGIFNSFLLLYLSRRLGFFFRFRNGYLTERFLDDHQLG
eukprot:jgi/Chlat1/2272/Chrsp17S00165